MSASMLAIDAVELESVLRPMGMNGAPSSQDYNALTSEILADLATITEALNVQVFPVLNALRSSAGLPPVGSPSTSNPVGIQGSTVISDSTDESSLFFDADTDTPLSVADSMRVLRGQISSIQTLANNLSSQVQTLATALSTTGQSDLASAITNMYVQIESIEGQLSSLAESVGGNTGMLKNIQSQTLPTPQINPAAVDSIPVNWALPFPDDTYAVSYALNDDSGNLAIQSFSYKLGGTGVIVRVKNLSKDQTVAGVICVTAREV